MYCKNCGTINPDIAEYCFKCGGALGETGNAGRETPSSVEIALAAHPAGGAYTGANKSVVPRAVIAVMVAGLLVMATTLWLLVQTGSAVYQRKDATPPYEKAEAGQTAANGGLGLVPIASPAALVNDAVRKANAMRLQASIAQFYAANDRYPATLAEIPPAALGFEADPKIYAYVAKENPYGFRLEVVMESANVSGANIVTDGGVTKYVYEGQ